MKNHSTQTLGFAAMLAGVLNCSRFGQQRGISIKANENPRAAGARRAGGHPPSRPGAKTH